MYKLLLTSRYLLRKWIALAAVLSVWACAAMVLIVFSVMDGFLENIKLHSRGILSDIIIDNSRLQGFPYYEEFGDFLQENMPGEIKVITPVIYNYGIIRIKGTSFTQPVRVLGIKMGQYCEVNTFCDGLYYDKYYPGTTTMGESRLPLAGIEFDANSNGAERFALPDDLEAAFARYKQTATKELEQERGPPSRSAPDGVGTFTTTFDAPGYEGDPMPGIVLGTDLVYERDDQGVYNRFIPRGAEIILTLLPLTPSGSMAKDPIPVALRHVDDCRTRVYDIDSICVYVDFDRLQQWLDMGPLERVDGTKTHPRTSQLLVALTDGQDINQARARITELWAQFFETLAWNVDMDEAELMQSVTVQTWEERQARFIAAVEKEKVLVTVLFGVIILVAVVMIGIVFYMAVIQKTRDIGIIKSLGATRWGVAAIFLTFGAAVGAIGGLLGVVSGSVFVHYINQIQDLLASMNPNFRVWSPDVYTFDQIPNVVKPSVAVAIYLAAIISATLGAVIPSIKAASVWPVRTLRYE